MIYSIRFGVFPIGVSEEERFGKERARRLSSSVHVALRAVIFAESSFKRWASAFRAVRSDCCSDGASVFVRAAIDSFAIVFSSCFMRDLGVLRS